MKKVIFYVHHEWAIGSIHIELMKHFFLRGINSYILPWDYNYSYEELLELNDDCDFILTNPHGYMKLRDLSGYKIPQNKFIVVAHARIELSDWQYIHQINECLTVHNFGVVSKFLQDQSQQMGFPKIPMICTNGINFDNFYAPIRSKLQTVGYGGTFSERNSLPECYATQPAAYKRGYLAKEAAAMAGLAFRTAQSYHTSYVTMPAYYRHIDSVIMCSSEEGAGMPVIEAGAAGCLVLSTPVGHCADRAGTQGADFLPIEENACLQQMVELLKYYANDDVAYRKRCNEIQEHARATYDWKYTIDSWISLI